jgi:hypothetical protein
MVLKNYILAILLLGLIASCNKESTKEPNKREYLVEATYLKVNGTEYSNQALVVIVEGQSASIESTAQYNIAPYLKISSNGYVYLTKQGYQNEVIKVNFKYQ